MGNTAYQIQVCRGLEGGCRFALWTDRSAVGALERLIAASRWVRQADVGRNGGAGGHHLKLKVALAACPNACTMPQICDIGIIAALTPRRVGPLCEACGACERLCREGAIGVSGGQAQLHATRCVGCGACIAACPREAIEAETVRLRVLVGGRMGRHPRWAESLYEVDAGSVAGVLSACLDGLAHERRGAERVADVVERIGMGTLRRHVREAVSEQLCRIREDEVTR